MSATTSTDRRELAHRQSDGIDVTLYWNQATNQVSVDVFDSHAGEALQFDVDGSDALEAFHHPYAHAAAQRIRRVESRTVPCQGASEAPTF